LDEAVFGGIGDGRPENGHCDKQDQKGGDHPLTFIE
jgi:hypothetical protein